MTEYEAPLDPFKILSVSPKRIERFTGRTYPPWQNVRRLFGSVKSGDWDREPPTIGNQEYDGTPAYLYLGDTFSDSILYNSLENHFDDDVPWEDTRIVRESLCLVEEPGHVWNCTCEREILEKCNELDRIYRDIKQEGELDMKQIEEDEGSLPLSILNRMGNHILVDIARDGELLFVEGRHRLSIAKILDLERVPVAVCVRHRKWMERRDEIYLNGVPETHPDLTELNRRGCSHTAFESRKVRQ